MTNVRLAVILIPSLTFAGQFTTSLGDQYPYTISSIAADGAGNTYVVGSRQLGSIPSGLATLSSIESALAQTDVFVSKIDPNGNVLFIDTFAGKGSDQGIAIAVDPSGSIYIAGTTTSSDFPLSKALQTQSNASGTGFIMKLSNDGTAILYSTYFGGTLGQSSISGLATDSQGNLYLTGNTTSADFPHTSGMPFNPIDATAPGVFFASISAVGDRILYSGAIVAGPPSAAGAPSPSAAGVAVDISGNAYFAGTVPISDSNAPPPPPPPSTSVSRPPPTSTGFVFKVSAGGTNTVYLNLNAVSASAIAIDSSGDIYFGGILLSGNPGIAKLDPTGATTLWTNNFNFLASSINSIALDPSGNLWGAGTTTVSTFPNQQGWTTGPEFVTALSSSGNQIYSALYPAGTVAQSVAIDPSGLVHVAGQSGFVSVINPAAAAPVMKIFDFQNAFGGNATARISPAEVVSISGAGIGPANPVSATPSNGFYPTTLAGVQVTMNGANIPLLYVSANQINAVVPMEIAAGPAIMRVINGTAVSQNFPVQIVVAAPQAFQTVLNQDGTINSMKNPAQLGSVVTIYATGWQSNFSPLTDGQLAVTAQNECAGCQATAHYGGFPWTGAAILYAGAAPGIVAGVTQINMNVGGTDGFITQNVTFLLTNPSTLSVGIWIEA